MALPQLQLKESTAQDWRALLNSAMSPRIMCEELNDHWPYAGNRGLEVIDCQLVRIYPRKNGGSVLEFELCLSGQGHERHQTVFAEWVGDNVVKRCQETITSLSKRRRGQLDRDDGDLVTCLPNMGLLIRFPGLDERIEGLKLINQPASLAQILRTLKNNNTRVPSGHVEVELLGHRLGKRCVVRVNGRNSGTSSATDTDCTFILKLYKMRTNRGRFVYDCMKRLEMNGFESESLIRIPQLLVYLSEWNALVMEDVRGVSLPMLSGDRLVDGLERAGQALRKLHNTPMKVEHRHSVDSEIELLEQRVGLVSRLMPELTDTTNKTLQSVVNELNQCRQFTPTLVHRDFYEKQILIDGDETILLDFDTLCMSDPALDVGNFIAHLELNRLQGILKVENGAAVFSDAYDGYQNDAFRRRVTIYARSAMLRLACLYAFWPRWRYVCRPLLEAANAR